MKLVPIILTSAILSGLAVLITTPSAGQVISAIKTFFKFQKPRKKRCRPLDEGLLFVMYTDTLDGSLTETLIPEISIQAGIQSVSLYDSLYFGRCKTECYREMIEQSSITLIVLTEDLIHDPWLKNVMALCFQKDIKSIYLCHDESVDISAVPQCVLQLIDIGCHTMSFKFGDKNLPELKHLASEIANFLTTPNNWKMPVLNGISCNHPLNRQYEAYFMCAPDISTRSVAKFAQLKEKYNICDSTEFTPGKYLYENYSVAIHSSKLIFVFITQDLVQHPLFEYQLLMALRCKGTASIKFVLEQNSSRPIELVANKRSFKYAYAACEKICIRH